MVTVTADPTIQRQVVAAAREVLASEPDAPVSDIAQRAGVSRATFYRHFGSRDALLERIAHEPRPKARERILSAAQEMLVRDSLADLSMDELARAAYVSRGTLYRIFPGKAALLQGLIAAYSPFEQIGLILDDHADDPPEVVLPLIASAVLGVAGERMGLMRAVFIEITSASETAVTGMRPVFGATLARLVEYMARQQKAGRVGAVHPLIALQTFIGPIFFHLVSRTAMERLAPLPMTAEQAVDQMVAIAVAGLTA
jgi:AcrR family transcriptional regulator